MNHTHKMNNTTRGYLEIFIGPMYSGKTSKILELYKKYTFCSIPIAVLNYSEDTRYHETMLSTHDKTMIPCIQTIHLRDVLETEQVIQAQVVLINEAQFFEDLYDCVLLLLKQNKKVYVSGLDGDFERKKFGQILELIPICDKIEKMHSFCSLCRDGTPGIFSLRLTSEKEQKLIGADNYIPVCRNCYEKKHE